MQDEAHMAKPLRTQLAILGVGQCVNLLQSDLWLVKEAGRRSIAIIKPCPPPIVKYSLHAAGPMPALPFLSFFTRGKTKLLPILLVALMRGF